jgi:hypothetical protein
MVRDESVIDWLLAGDAAVRWQVMRDLLGEPAETWKRERSCCRILAETRTYWDGGGLWPNMQW